MKDRFDPANREKHGLSLSFGDTIFQDNNHLIISSTRDEDGEESFKVIGAVEENLLTSVFVWR